jgi:hypothetical protein
MFYYVENSTALTRLHYPFEKWVDQEYIFSLKFKNVVSSKVLSFKV